MSVTVPPPTPVPPPGYWPMPPPGTLPGCGPPNNSLMDCYWSVQSATAFISAIMIDAVNNNPAVAQAIIAAIEKSGSALPLIGVTNGADAQPGQVGEFVSMIVPVAFTAAAQQQTVTLGILQPGDWDVWLYAGFENAMVHDLHFLLSPVPPGFEDSMAAFLTPAATATWFVLASPVSRALISLPSLIAVQIQTNYTGAGPAAGSFYMVCYARRRR